MIEILPHLSKTDSNLKTLQRKLDENEQRVAKTEKQVDKKFKEIQNSERINKNHLDPKSTKHMEDLGSKITDIENSLSNVYRWHEAKMREESCLV